MYLSEGVFGPCIPVVDELPMVVCAPTFYPLKAEWSLEVICWVSSLLRINDNLAIGRLRIEVDMRMLASRTFPSLPGMV